MDKAKELLTFALCCSDPWERMTKMRIHTAHRANIFSAKFMPHTANKKIVSCSGDGIVIYTGRA